MMQRRRLLSLALVLAMALTTLAVHPFVHHAHTTCSACTLAAGTPLPATPALLPSPIVHKPASIPQPSFLLVHAPFTIRTRALLSLPSPCHTDDNNRSTAWKPTDGCWR
jgi:hypothetical protein